MGRFLYGAFMTHSPQVDHHVLDEFNVKSPELITETNIARIWRVVRHDQSFAVLKVYKGNDMLNEKPGFDLLRLCDGHGAAIIFRTSATAALMELLEGPSLGDMARSGNDMQSAGILVEVANKLHAKNFETPNNWPRLRDFAADLTKIVRGKDCNDTNWRNFAFSRSLAFQLIEREREICPLHGDLHHDNILLGERGYCAIDAKGVVGDRGYELANAFRNPKGAAELVQDPERFSYLLDLWSSEFNIDKHHMLDWAIAKTAFSIMWRNKETLNHDPDFKYLDMIIDKKSMMPG